MGDRSLRKAKQLRALTLTAPLLLILALTGVAADDNSVAAEWKRLFEGGQEAYGDGKLDIARDQWSAALLEAEEIGRSSPEHIQTLERMARLEELTGKPHEAERYWRIRVDVLRSTMGSEQLELAAARHDLAQFLERHRRFDEAETLLRDNLDSYTLVFTDGTFLADPHLDLARHFMERGDLQSAESQLNAALAVFDRYPPVLAKARALRRYATVLSLSGREEAAKQAREAADLIENKLAPEIEENRRRVFGSEEP